MLGGSAGHYQEDAPAFLNMTETVLGIRTQEQVSMFSPAEHGELLPQRCYRKLAWLTMAVLREDAP